MSKSPAESAEGSAAKNSTTYLTEPLITEDGLTIPPPARPMGPRRLARYYEEVADYLRAVERGDDPLRAVPMFMGGQAPVPKSQSAGSLDQLASLGSIDQEVTSDGPELDFDQTQATVLEDPLANIGQQIYAGNEQVEPTATYTSADYASPTGDLLGDAAFVPDELTGEGAADVQSELPHETPADTQVELPEETPEHPQPELPEFSLPAPVRAVDAQGLDLTELDETLPAGLSDDVTEPATVNSSEQVDRAVDSESSDETEETLMGDHSSEIMTEESGEEYTAQPTDREVEVADQGETIDTTDETSQSTDTEVATEQADQPAALSGAMASIIGIVVLLALLLVVWFFFFQ